MKDSTKNIIGSMAAAVGAVLVAAGERNAASLTAMYAYMLASIALLGIAVCLAGMGIVNAAEEEKIRKAKRRYIDRSHARCEEPEYRQTRRDA